MQELFSTGIQWLAANPMFTGWYTAIARLLFPILSVLILARAIRSLLRVPHTPEVWAQLSLPNGSGVPLTHWENIIGRSRAADVVLNYPSISRQHATLCRGDDGAWTLYDLGSKGGTAVNGTPVTDKAPVKLGDTITFGGVPLVFLPQTVGGAGKAAAGREARRYLAILCVADGLSGINRRSGDAGGGRKRYRASAAELSGAVRRDVALRGGTAAGALRGL